MDKWLWSNRIIIGVVVIVSFIAVAYDIPLPRGRLINFPGRQWSQKIINILKRLAS